MQQAFVITIVAVIMLFAGCVDQPAGPQVHSDDAFKPDGGGGSLSKGAILNFIAPLDGSQEVPPAETNATGITTFRLSKDGNSLSYRLIVANIENVTMAHIHLAPRDVNGPVVVWLYPDAPPAQLIPGKSNGILAQGTITAENLVGPLADHTLADLIAELQDENAYVNVHTSQYPGGEIRGQIERGNGM